MARFLSPQPYDFSSEFADLHFASHASALSCDLTVPRTDMWSG